MAQSWIAVPTLALCAGLIVARAPAADALSLLPATADAVIGADLAAARGSAIYERLAGQPQLDMLTDLTGVDPRRDVDRLTIAVWGPQGDRQSFLAVLEGDLAAKGATRSFLEEADAAGSVDGVKLYERRADGDGRLVTFGFLDGSTALAGDRDSVVAAIARRGAGSAGSLRGSTLGAQAEAAARKGQLWMSARRPSENLGASAGMLGPEIPRAAQMLTSLESLSFSADMLQDLAVTLSGRCASPREAESLANTARGLLAIARVSAPATEPEMRSLLAATQVVAREETSRSRRRWTRPVLPPARRRCIADPCAGVAVGEGSHSQQNRPKREASAGL